MATALLWSCGKDDGTTPPADKNAAPMIIAQEFTALEAIVDTEVIGTVDATDADKDELTFSIKTNDDNLFEITAAGDLSLAAGKSLDFDTKAQHKITVEVTDGEAKASAEMTIKVIKEGADPTNSAPEMADQEFTVAEDIADTEDIGTVEATDPDGDTLTFNMVANDDDLFEVTTTGKLSLATGKALDFETKAQHSITVRVSDGDRSATAQITIKVTPKNSAPEMANQEFTVAEDIADTEVIGKVVATDADGDTLTFGIFDDGYDLFEIDAATGEISLKAGKALDFETETKHVIAVEVGDGIVTAETSAIVTINVTDVDDSQSLADDPASFITTWKTDTDNEEVIIGTNANYTYDYAIDWGDGTVEQINSSANATHTYATAGTYTVAIKGQFPVIYMDSNDDDRYLKLMSIEQWGNIQWERMYGAFASCENMVYNATDVPDLSQVTDMSFMFYGATVFNGDLSGWDTSSVTTMSGMFYGATSFNGNISGWDTSSVTKMIEMFNGAISFNGDISGWDTSSVTRMQSMFYGATAFNQSLGNWNILNVTNMANMLDNCGMSKANLRDTLGGWLQFVVDNNLPKEVALGLDGLTLCAESTQYVLDLQDNHGWVFAGTAGYQANCLDQ